MEAILQPDYNIDIKSLDQVVDTFYNGSGIEQQKAQAILTTFQESPDSWMKVDKILQFSKNTQTRFIALSILDRLIKTRWKSLPRSQQIGIRDFIVGMSISLCGDQELNTTNGKQLIQKSDITLVEILKQEWPEKWPDFIPELINSSSLSMNVCENNLTILKLLFEEIFDFSEDQMTQAKVLRMKKSMSEVFAQIYKHIIDILNLDQSSISLQKAALQCLLDYLEWVPPNYIFESNVLDMLSTNYLNKPESRNIALKCLTETTSIPIPDKNSLIIAQIIDSFGSVLKNLTTITPSATSALKLTYATSNFINQQFFQDLALYLTKFLSSYRTKLEIENAELRTMLLTSHSYLIQLSRIDEPEIFKICLDYWHNLVAELFTEVQQYPIADVLPSLEISFELRGSGAMNSQLLKQLPLKKNIYEQICSQLRKIIITEKMSRPEEIVVVKDVDSSEVIRQFVNNTDMLDLYQSEKEVLVCLTYLNFEDTESIVSQELDRQIELLLDYTTDKKENQNGWAWDSMNCLCWSIGSISCTMSEENENFFIKTILEKLTTINDSMIANPNDRAIFDSNVMYIVGQYPRFLKNHWAFLINIMDKLFQCMHDENEGIQDMACDTFMKIVDRCKYQFVINKQEVPEHSGPLIEEIINNIEKITSDLKPSQLCIFYEACGLAVREERNYNLRGELLKRLMRLPNLGWSSIINETFSINAEHKLKALLRILDIYISVSKAVGPTFTIQLELTYLELFELYKLTSDRISEQITLHGITILDSSNVRELRSIKKKTLVLIKIFVTGLHPNEFDKYTNSLINLFLNTVLKDFSLSPPQSKEPELLSCLNEIVIKCGQRYNQYTTLILENVFISTLDMIKTDFNDFPEHRILFYKLLRTINLKNFSVLLGVKISNFFQQFFDSICWTFKHHNREIEEIGLQIAIELVKNIDNVNDTPFGIAFYQTFYLPLVSETLSALTEPDHKPVFSRQALLLRNLLALTYDNRISAALDQGDTLKGYSNTVYLNDYITNLLTKVFSTVTVVQVQSFITALMKNYNNVAVFSNTVHDFLIQVKEVGGDPSDYLFDEGK